MGPGIPNPMLWGSGDPLDELGKIERSVRLRRSAGAMLYRTPTIAGSLTTWTYSFWLKLGAIVGSNVYGLAVNHGDGGTYRDFLAIQADQLRFDVNSYASTWAGHLRSNALFRDPGAHVNIQAVFDSTNAVAADRMRLYVSGVRLASFSSQKLIDLNATSWTNQAGLIHRIGADLFAGSAQHLDGELAHFAFVDGKALEPSAFGQFHPRTGQWRPKSKAAIRAAVAAGGGTRNGWGVNGCFLTFDDPTSPTTLGYDRSQSDTDTTGNNWTPNNISLTPGATYDSMRDTPTDVFSALSPSLYSVYTTPGLITDGNLKHVTTAANSYSYAHSSIRLPKEGEWYFEGVWTGTLNSSIGQGIGIKNEAFTKSVFLSALSTGTSIFVNNIQVQTGLPTIVSGDSFAVKYNAGAGSLQFYRNGAAYGVEVTGIIADDYFFSVETGNSSAGAYSQGFSVNFGQRPFAYPENQGSAKALCTKNLPVRYPVMRSADAFVAKTDSGANIKTALEAASPWDKWIRIYKRRDAAEGWRWQFSDDSGYYLDSSASSAKAAFPTLAGTSYVGYALKVAAQNGVATGRLNHVTGTPSVVADGLANSRKAVILVNEAGSNWFFYHPDLTAGKLIYLNLTNAETTDATIGIVTASGFTVTATLASGTYRWVALAEVDGFLKLGKYTGNGLNDGSFVNASIQPDLLISKKIDTTVITGGVWNFYDTTRTPRNQVESGLTLNSNGTEISPAEIDLVSNGFKYRGASNNVNFDHNLANAVSVYVDIGKPFRYANAR